MGNIPERKSRDPERNASSDPETSNEPRKGIAPFAGELPKKIREDRNYISKVIQPIPFGSLGQANIYLTKPQNGKLEEQISKDEQAFTIDLSGEIHTGNLHDFINAGYYMVRLLLLSQTETRQQLTANIWIDQAKPIFSADIGHVGAINFSCFSRTTKGIRESFVLPENPEILRAVRLNVASRHSAKFGLSL